MRYAREALEISKQLRLTGKPAVTEYNTNETAKPGRRHRVEVWLVLR